MIRRLVSAATGFLLLLALLLALLWFWRARTLEAADSVFLALAALVGIPADRWAAARQRRRRALRAIADELRKNQELLADPRFRTETEAPLRPDVYPRLALAAVDTALISGALAGPTEGEFVRRLFHWRDTAGDFNRRLDLTEMRLFTEPVSQRELLRFRRVFHGDDGYFHQVCEEIGVVQAEVERAESRRTSLSG